MFIAGSLTWSVRSIADHPNSVYIVWASGEDRLVGVAGHEEGLAELFIDVVRDYEAGRTECKAYRIYRVARERGRLYTRELIGTITRDDDPNADHFHDFGKGTIKSSHHVVVRPYRKKHGR